MPKNIKKTKAITSKVKSSSVKKRKQPSLKQMLLFALLFGLVGANIIYRSLAASPVIAATEAEAMTLPAGSSVIADSNASGGKALKLTQNGSSAAVVNLPSQATSVTVTARGDQCSGSPLMTVTLDGANVLSNFSVSSTGYSGYTSTINLGAGSHQLNIAGSNLGTVYKGRNKPRCSRVLYLDVATFYGPSPTVTPTPTVSLSASPTTVAAGSGSALTWSSTDATSCTASGGWSGTKATSGTGTVTPSATATYVLSCTGAGGSASASTTVTVGATPATGTLNSTLGFKTLNTTVSDEFNGGAGTKPDSTRWGSKQYTATNGSVVYWNGMNNVSMDGAGNLDVAAIRDSSGGWTSGWISGNKSYSGVHYLEARAKVAAGSSGPWSGPIWEWDAPYGSQGIENDVNEQIAKEPQAYHTTLHSSGTQVSKTNTTAAVLANDYHIYSAAVYADHVDYYIDGIKIQTITKTELGGKWGYVENPMVLNIDLDMGGWGGTPSTTLPGTVHMLVDYIRVYTP